MRNRTWWFKSWSWNTRIILNTKVHYCMKRLIQCIGWVFLWLYLLSWINFSYAGSESNFWIDMNTDCLLKGTCHFSVYDATQIRKDSRADWEETSVMTFVQDIIYWATFFIGTVVTAWIIVSLLLLVFSWANPSMKTKAMTGLKYSLYWFVVVSLSLVIIRLVQFLAKWGSS